MITSLNNVSQFRFYMRKVLPLVYDESLSYYEFLCKVMAKLNEVIDLATDQNTAIAELDAEIASWESDTDDKYDAFVEQIQGLMEDFMEDEGEAREEFEGNMNTAFTTFINSLITPYANLSYPVSQGTYTVYENQVYKAVADIETSEAFTPAHWTEVVFATDLSNREAQFEETMTEAFEDFFETYIQTLGVVQTTGSSTTDVMSQKAVTDELALKVNATQIVQETGTETTDIMSQDAVTTALEGKVNTSDIVQVSGVAQDKIMSQYAVNEAVSGKLDTSDVVQTTGTATDKVMSQKAVTDTLDSKLDDTTVVQVTGSNTDKIMSQKAVTDELSGKVDTTDIVQSTGSNSGKLMSQKAVTDALNDRFLTANVVQSTGQSETRVMSQKAVTDAIDDFIPNTDIVQETGTSTSKIMSQDAVTDALALKVNSSDIVQTVGTQTDKVMSQGATKSALDEKFDNSDIVQTTGTSTDKVMSQKAVTDELDSKVDNTQIVQDYGESETNIMSQKIVSEELEKKSNVDGYYTDMGVGTAEQLISTTTIENKEPYGFRTTGGSADVGNRMNLNKLIGCSIVWNQYYKGNPTLETRSGVTATEDEHGLITYSGTATSGDNFHMIQIADAITVYNNHYYLVALGTLSADSSGGNATLYFRNETQSVQMYQVALKITHNEYAIFKNTTGDGICRTYLNMQNGAIVSGSIFPLMIDLSLMFGSVASEITVEQFFSILPKKYYDYSAPILVSSNSLGLKDNTGVNLYNHSDGGAKLLGGYQYQITGAYTSLSYTTIDETTETITPDSSGYFTPSQNGMLTVNGGDSTSTCVHLVWSGEYDDVFVEYSTSKTMLPTGKLRGVMKMDDDGKLYADGDYIESDGTKHTKYALLDLGTLTYTKYTVDSGTLTMFRGNVSNIKPVSSGTIQGNILCDLYSTVSNTNRMNKCIKMDANKSAIDIIDNDYADSDATAFKTAMTGVYLIYELATESVTQLINTFANEEIINDYGTEEILCSGIDENDNEVFEEFFIGQESEYRMNLRDKLQRLPEIPSSNGTYAVNFSTSENKCTFTSISTELANISTLMSRVPAPPSTNGTYTLKCTVSGDTVTFTWTT